MVIFATAKAGEEKCCHDFSRQGMPKLNTAPPWGSTSNSQFASGVGFPAGTVASASHATWALVLVNSYLGGFTGHSQFDIPLTTSDYNLHILHAFRFLQQ